MDVLAVDRAAFPPFWQFDDAGLSDALQATPAVRFRAAMGSGNAIAGYAICGRSGRSRVRAALGGQPGPSTQRHRSATAARWPRLDAATGRGAGGRQHPGRQRRRSDALHQGRLQRGADRVVRPVGRPAVTRVPPSGAGCGLALALGVTLGALGLMVTASGFGRGFDDPAERDQARDQGRPPATSPSWASQPGCRIATTTTCAWAWRRASPPTTSCR